MTRNVPTFVIPDHVMGSKLEDEYVILNTQTGYYYDLNRVGAEIWEMIAEGRSAQVIVDALAAHYETPRDILTQDFQELIDDLIANGILDEIDESTPDMDGPASP